MKHMPLLFIFTMFIFAVGCQESTKKSSSSSNTYCAQNPYAYGCSGSTVGGTTGTSSQCSGNGYWQVPGCIGYCQNNPTHSSCTSGGTTGGTTNPYPQYPSSYINKYWYLDENWMVHYPLSPSVSCIDATAPSGISYTPYETRKATITLRGGKDYNPNSGQIFFDTTSELLRTVNGARQFFWGDSTLKVRFKSNLQPESRRNPNVCPERTGSLSTLKGYGQLNFDIYLIGRDANGDASQPIFIKNETVSVQTCTTGINLSTYAAAYPNGIYLEIRNVRSNQGGPLPGTPTEQIAYNKYGYIYPQNPNYNKTWGAIRTAECWSLDVEVAADGTKTFN